MYQLICIIFLLLANVANAGVGWVDIVAGQFPPIDSLHPIVWRNKVYSFGGFTENQDPAYPNVWTNAVWVFDGFSWKELITTGTPPTPRGYEVTFLRGNSLYVVLGGSYNSSFGNIVQTNEMHALDLTTNIWSLVSYSGSNAPGGLFGAAGFYDQTSDSLYISGGINFIYFAVKADTWVFQFSTSTWTKLTLSTAPSGRYDTSYAYNTRTRKFYVYAGETVVFTQYGPSFVIPTDIFWVFDVASQTWTELFPSACPTPRNNGNGMVYIPGILNSGYLLIYGGDIGGGPTCPFWYLQNSQTDTWVYDISANKWTQLPFTSTPPALKRAGTVLYGIDVFIFGGFYFVPNNCNVFRNQDTWTVGFN